MAVFWSACMPKDGCYAETRRSVNKHRNTRATCSFCCPIILVYMVGTPYNLWRNGASLDKQIGTSRTVKYRHIVSSNITPSYIINNTSQWHSRILQGSAGPIYLAYFSVPMRERSTSFNHCATTSTSFLTRMFFSNNSFSSILLLSRLFRNISDYRINSCYINIALYESLL